METWDAVRARRNVRQHTDQPIDRDDLERILEAGRRSPSSSNWQPWHFVVVTDHEQLTELAQVWQGAGHIAGSAATVALVAQQPEDDRTRQRIAYDFGQATAFMMITAADLGIGSGHSAVADQEQAQRVLGFPDGYFCVYLIGFGYPAAAAAGQAGPPSLRRGRALGPLVTIPRVWIPGGRDGGS
jgi:nitroreductase